ncbi:MAG: TIGR02221 family CRISPR-associated protein [Ottowia sp.]|nr:TIGR02221 family CRISPR-associated protein [Ottowia sp.]
MGTTLISFLGGNKPDGYNKARYQFPDGVIHETEYFGLALKEHLQSSGTLEKLILLGTDTSMWDVFSYSHYDENTQAEVSVIMKEMEEEGKATQESLKKLGTKLAVSFGVPTECILIPYARDSREQAEILTSLAKAVENNGNIVLDVTHGLRHLSMLALIAASYLKHVRRVNIQDVYYGAFELRANRDSPAPVVNLKGMLQMLDWVEALAIYDHSGDYGVFAKLFQQDGMAGEHADQLRRAAFFERSTNPEQAKQHLTGAFEHIRNHTGALGQLFSAPLAENVAWFKAENRAERELELADRYLERRDYLRAIMFMQEGFVSRAVLQQRGDPGNFDERKSALDHWRATSEDFRLLANLRNAVAHGLRSNSVKISRLLRDEEKLAQKLRQLRKTMF